jgi:cell division protease FtsH
MVGRWGMSRAVGPLVVIPEDGRGPLLPGTAEVSEHTQQLVDEEARRIVEDAEQEVLALLQENRGRLESLAHALLEHETLDEDDAYAAAGVEHAHADDAGRYAAALPRAQSR